jgi:hypothetical protein
MQKVARAESRVSGIDELIKCVKKLAEKSFGRLVIEKHDKHFHVEETDKRHIDL